MLMQADLSAALGPIVVPVVSLAVAGSTFNSDLAGTAPNTLPLATRLAQAGIKPGDIVISDSEINDQYVLHELPSDYTPNVEQWISTVQSFGAIPVLEEPTPICQPDMDLAMTADFVSDLHLIATERGVTVLPVTAAFEAFPNWCSALIGPDFTHLNVTGYAFREAQEFPPLLALVKQALAQ